MYAMYYQQEVVGGEEGTAGGDEGDGTGGEDGVMISISEKMIDQVF